MNKNYGISFIIFCEGILVERKQDQAANAAWNWLLHYPTCLELHEDPLHLLLIQENGRGSAYENENYEIRA